ncbi:bacterio-opsin activator HTH domain-containing protein [Natronococcus amylolyticus DSM 10524]|uniref:Bacterio-opsin activator HTH domain-containing protein n=1 Tax=Natronococcus amylolyticus DSM 10524 TaxID=1227497 RepID=L9X389_9EURY|nr:helix-turn-helix domain-containing protein [Natronococcus amylolyticus]ELY56067.1 bacterio-opsin activator HTH domain-containing protein [Natronococcus amylolyticus DSM 10524]
MSVVAEFTIPADAFALEHTFETAPDATVEIERLATHSREWVMPFLWVTSDDLEVVERALEADPDVEEVRTLNVTDDIGYFNVRWSEEVQQLIDEVVDQHGIVQEAEAKDGRWYLKLKFVSESVLEEFQAYFRRQNRTFELQRLYRGIEPKERRYDLTPEQREVLTTAQEMGYFEVPRETQIEELAAELDISTNSVSQRLRRATDNLVRNTLTVSTPSGLPDAN